MRNLRRRITMLERGSRDGRPRILPFPDEGMTPEEVEVELARYHARGPLSREEWAAEHNAEVVPPRFERNE